MTLEGLSLSGLRIEGRKNLQSIGDMVLWHDYRNGYYLTPFTYIPDLTGRGHLLTYNRNNTNILASDGYRPLNAGPLYWSNPSDLCTRIQSGNAYLFYTVAYINQALNQYCFFFSNSTVTQSQGTHMGFTNTSAQQQMRLGGLLMQGTSGFVIQNEFQLYRFIFYGSAAGANNVKMIVGANSNLFTRASGFGGTDTIAKVSITGALTSLRIKFQALYDCTGKTISEIDAIDAEFVSILKEDVEYSGLTT